MSSDAGLMVQTAKSRQPGLPLFLLGHSAGGVVSCLYTLEHQDELTGLICESFAFRVPAPEIALAAFKGIESPRAARACSMQQKTRILLARSRVCQSDEQRSVDRRTRRSRCKPSRRWFAPTSDSNRSFRRSSLPYLSCTAPAIS